MKQLGRYSMKKASIVIGLVTMLSMSTIASAGELDGLKFCRSVQTGGMLGQPEETRLHCVSFNNDVATDNENTFFGNPPESYHYTVNGASIINADTGKPTSYMIQRNDIVITETKDVLSRQ
jgi:hypothetical protein